MNSNDINGTIFIAALSFCFLYMFVSALFEHKRIHFIHETGVAMTLGFLVGLLTFFSFQQKFQTVTELNDDVVFFVLLPFMLFSDGFNLKKRRFFQNIFYINIYGVVGTIFNFFVVVGIITLANSNGLIRDFSNIQSVRTLSTWQILLFGAAMCSMDDVAATSTIKPETHPKIFSIVFGEALMKDCVTIVLFKSISNLINQNSSYAFDFQWYSPFQILGNFLQVIIVSTLIGIVYALALTVLFKHCRFIIHNRGTTELGLTFLCGFIAYLTCEILGYSGIISMMVSGIVLSHFNTYNMSKSGLEASKLAFKTISIVSQGLLFLLLGLASWQFQSAEEDATVSWTFIIFGFIAIFAGRIVNIVVTTLLFYLCVGVKRWRLNRFELEIIGVSGVVKGAVPFALITTLAIDTNATSHVTTYMLKSTVIAIVFLSSILFNGLIPMFIKWKLNQIKEKIKDDHQSNIDNLKDKEVEEYNRYLKGEPDEERKYRSKTQKYWRRFEDGYLKPFLIYNYKGRREEIQVDKNRQRVLEFGIKMGEVQAATVQMALAMNDSITPINDLSPQQLVFEQSEQQPMPLQQQDRSE